MKRLLAFIFWIGWGFHVLAVPPSQNVTLQEVAVLAVESKREFYASLRPEQLADRDQYFEFLNLGLQDADLIVQRNAAGQTAVALTSLQSIKRENGVLPISSEKLPALQKTLRQMTNVIDVQVRSAVLSSLIFSDAPNAEIEGVALGQGQREENPEVKAAILKSLVDAGYRSDQINNALISALSDKDMRVRERTSRIIAEVKPPGALPKLAELLKDQQMARDFVVQAIAAYGIEALPYLPNLEKLLTDPSIGGTLPGRVRAAIDNIKNPPPQAAATPQIKAVSLLSSAPSKPAQSVAAQMPPPSSQQSKLAASPTPTVAAEKQPSSSFPVVPVVILAAVIAGAFVFLLRRKSAK